MTTMDPNPEHQRIARVIAPIATAVMRHHDLPSYEAFTAWLDGAGLPIPTDEDGRGVASWLNTHPDGLDTPTALRATLAAYITDPS